MTDSRIVYGAHCMWWDSIYKVGHIECGNGARLPCCPHCHGVLFEKVDENAWWEGADEFEANGHPGYRATMEWGRGKCFPTYQALQKAYAERKLS